MRVLLAPSSFGASDGAPLARLAEAGITIVKNPFGRKLSKEEVRELLPGLTGIISGLEPLSRDILERSELKVISRCGAGLDNVDLAAAADLKIRVLATLDAPTTAVAELTVGAMITLMRRVPRMDRDLHEGRWVKQLGVQLEGKTVLIIGFGRIGRRVARLLRAFDVELCAADPALTGTVDGVPVLPLHAALARADVISLHAGGDAPILAEPEFSSMKRGAFVLIAGRSSIVSESCLQRALDADDVAGAWLDVFSEEPYAGPLTQYPQVMLTPHCGSYSVECRRRMEMEAVENLLGALRP